MVGIAIDIDGTLTDSSGFIDPEVKAAFLECQSKHCVILASARPPRGIDFFSQLIGASGSYIALNGGVVLLREQAESIMLAELDRLALDEISAKVQEIGEGIKAIFVFDQANLIAWGDRQLIEEEAQLTSMQPIILSDRGQSFCYANIIKVTLVCPDRSLARQACLALKSGASGLYSATRSRNSYIEVTAPSNGKGAALRLCKQRLGITWCVAIGDGENDISMFSAADVSYAMSSAPRQVKKHATHVVKHRDLGVLLRAI